MNRKEHRALAHANSKTTTPPSVTVNTVEEPVTAPKVKPEISEGRTPDECNFLRMTDSCAISYGY